MLAQIRPALTAKKTIISFAASVKTGAIEKAAGVDLAVIRAMPNTPSLLGAERRHSAAASFVTAEQMAIAEQVFATVGRTVIVDEKHMDAVTGLSGSAAPPTSTSSGIACGGWRQGRPAPRHRHAAGRANRPSAPPNMVLETGYHPALLKDAVTTPAGCTIDGILELEEGGLRVTLIKAVMRAAQRAKELASS